jgi:hypothetical protein
MRKKESSMEHIQELLLDENNIAFHPTMGNSYQLNTVGSEIITLLKKQKDKEEIIEILHEKFSISKDALFIDVSDFMTKMKIYGLFT